MRSKALRSIKLIRLFVGFGLAGVGMAASAQAQQAVSPYYTAPGNYGTSYGYSSYGAVRTYSQYGSPAYGRGGRPYVTAQNQWGSGIWGQNAPQQGAPVQVPQPAGRYQTWAAPYRPGQVANPPAPPMGAYAPTVAPGYGMRRPSAY